MDSEVVWSLSATADLESIVEHIFRDSEFYAATVACEQFRKIDDQLSASSDLPPLPYNFLRMQDTRRDPKSNP